jgi:membrane dipeptidase
VKVGGIECMAIGTDYDGIDATVTGLENSARLPALFEALEKAGFTQDDMEKIRYRNALRVIRDVCG